MAKLQDMVQVETATVQYGNLPLTFSYSFDGASLAQLLELATAAKALRGESSEMRNDTALALVYASIAAYVRSWDLEENDSTPEKPHYVALTEERLNATGADKLPGNLIIAVFNELFKSLPTAPSASPDASHETPSSDTSESVTA